MRSLFTVCVVFLFSCDGVAEKMKKGAYKLTPISECSTKPPKVEEKDLCGIQTKEGLACTKCQGGMVGCGVEKWQLYCVRDCSDMKCVVKGGVKHSKQMAMQRVKQANRK